MARKPKYPPGRWFKTLVCYGCTKEKGEVVEHPVSAFSRSKDGTNGYHNKSNAARKGYWIWCREYFWKKYGSPNRKKKVRTREEKDEFNRKAQAKRRKDAEYKFDAEQLCKKVLEQGGGYAVAKKFAEKWHPEFLKKFE